MLVLVHFIQCTPPSVFFSSSVYSSSIFFYLWLLFFLIRSFSIHPTLSHRHPCCRSSVLLVLLLQRCLRTYIYVCYECECGPFELMVVRVLIPKHLILSLSLAFIAQTLPPNETQQFFHIQAFAQQIHSSLYIHTLCVSLNFDACEGDSRICLEWAEKEYSTHSTTNGRNVAHKPSHKYKRIGRTHTSEARRS